MYNHEDVIDCRSPHYACPEVIRVSALKRCDPQMTLPLLY